MAKKKQADESTTEAPSGIQHIKIQGVIFQAPSPYAEGHTLNAAEASAMNGLLGENLRNNFAKTVSTAKEQAGEGNELSADTLTSLHAKFAEYAAAYQFSARGPGRAPVDPVEKAARELGRKVVLDALNAKGIKKDQLAEGQMDTLIDQVLSKYPHIREEAASRIAKAKELSASVMGGLDFGQGDSSGASA